MLWQVAGTALPGIRRGHLNPGDSLGVAAPIPVSRASQTPGIRQGSQVAWASRCRDELRAVELPLGTEVRGGQLHLVVHAGQVLGGNADLDHLDPCRGLEDPVADLRGLDHAIPGGPSTNGGPWSS